MSYTTVARNNMLGAIGATHLSAHTAWSSTGTNEVTGGSPAYARKAATWAAAAGEQRAISGAVTFDIPAASTVRFIGMWDAITAGNFLGMAANAGSEKEFHVDITGNIVSSTAHGFVANEKITFTGDTPPGGLTEGTVYFAVTVTTDTFQVSLTSGGAAIDLTSLGATRCVVSKIVEETFGSQGTLQATAYTLGLNA